MLLVPGFLLVIIVLVDLVTRIYVISFLISVSFEKYPFVSFICCDSIRQRLTFSYLLIETKDRRKDKSSFGDSSCSQIGRYFCG